MYPLVAQHELPGIWLLTSPWMMLWALAAVIPVVIHFWSRRRYDEVPWAAMRFLLQAIRKNARRWRIEQLLLLVVRVLILVCLAIALADPMAALRNTGARGREPAGDTHHVLVLDASYSMDYRPAEKTLFETAQGLASEFVRQARQGDGFTLIQLSDPPRVLVGDPVFDRESMVTEIAQVARTDGGADLEATLAEVQRVLSQAAEHTTRLRRARVSFFTDLGRNTWHKVLGESVQTALVQLARQSELNVIDVGQSGGQNVAITRLSASQAVVTVDAPVRLEIEVENFGSQDRPQQAVSLLVDGQAVTELNANVAGGSRASLAAVHHFQTPGPHVVEARLSDDPLAADNRRWLVLHVRETLEVLCVEGKSGAARNVVLALEPIEDTVVRIRPVVRSEIALLEEDLDRYDCVVLCNVGRFGTDEARLLQRFLERGGGVVIILGDQVQAANYNAVLGPDAGQHRCFSTRLEDPVELGQYSFDPREYRHDIVEPFRGHERAGLLTTPVWKYIRAVVEPNASTATALAFGNGDPALVEETVGAGHVVLLLTDASSVSVDRSTDPPTPWSALAAWPSFPPLIQQMLLAAVQGRGQARNVLVGEALRGWLPPGSAHTSVLVDDPLGRTQRVPVEVDGILVRWTLDDTRVGGVYRVSWLGGEQAHLPVFAANLDTSESRRERFDRDQLPDAWRPETAVDDPAESRLDPRRPVPLFRSVLAVVFGLLLGETFLAWVFGRGAL